ncbi:MAG: FG-GAP repeat protein [Candidatus Marinimicrobia bacterium]|nr:FG-GAP repeat protein [Candidatus Neomarinimicrobiota bacterium]
MPATPSLKEVESTFQKLQFQLSINISQRLKLRLLADFSQLLLARERLELNHSYYQELIPNIPDHISRESLKYQPLELLKALFQTLVYMDRSPEFQTSGPQFSNSLDLIRYQTAATAFYVGAWQLGLETIIDSSAGSIDLNLFKEYSDLNQLLDDPRIKELPETQYQIIEQIQEEWQFSTTGSSNDEVWIPLVEKWESQPGQELVVGTLYPLQLNLEERKNNHNQDLTFFNNHPIGTNDLVNYQAQDAIKAARSQHSPLRAVKAVRYSVMFGFPANDYFYSGSSFGFGMSLLSLCALEEQTNLRWQHSISRMAAFSGGIDLRGAIRAVTGSSLAEKIAAVFFSPIEVLVLPQENLPAGQELVQKLKHDYPKKKFSLIGAVKISSTLAQDELITRKKMRLIPWMKNHLTGNKLLQLVFYSLVAILVSWGLHHQLSDPNPSKYAVEGETVRFYNKNGSYLWSMDLGFLPTGLDGSRGGFPKFKRLQIGDYDGDGEDEVILGTAIKNRNYGGRLYFVETDGSIKWIYSGHPRLLFRGNEYSDTYATSFIYPYKHADSDTYDFYVTHMLFGDGGTTGGVKKYVDAGREGMFGTTRLSKPVISNIDSSIPEQVIFTSVITFDELVGVAINEMALQMANGFLYSLTTFPDLSKTENMQILFNWRINFI